MVKRMDLCASRYAACVDAVGASIVCNIRAHLQAPAMQAILPTWLMTAMQILDFECVDSKSSQVESSLYHGGRCET